ncbi:phosphorylcholine transferase LicD [Methanobrevibacter sp.]|uniref:LicD family protein n=1 Tax=Methanobrevibacter sp. TaxID=66852 RepID=UPI00388D9D1D
MGIKGYVSNLILSRSGSYKYYKEKYEELNKRVEKLEKQNKKPMDERVAKLEKKMVRMNKINNTNNRLFNTLYLDHKLEPSLLLSKFQEFCLEYLKFVENICNKYELEWMIEGGSFLGAIRHGGFIPWDDDIDCGMMRKDYNKFIEVLPHEIKSNNLEDIMVIAFKERDEIVPGSCSFLQLKVYNTISERENLMTIDFFPYDFLKNYNGEKLDDIYEEVRVKYLTDMLEIDDFDEVLDRYYNNLNLTYEKTPYFIQGVDGTAGKNRSIKVKVFDTDKMLPFKRVKFENTQLPGPKDYDYYLTLIYKDYWGMPSKLHFHKRMKRLRRNPDIYYILDEYIARFKKVNENY